jgi:hypothetical protein
VSVLANAGKRASKCCQATQQPRCFLRGCGQRERGWRRSLTDFTKRSTLGIFGFLGQVPGSRQRRSAAAGTEVCITLDGRGAHPDRANGQVLFHLTHDPAQARFGVEDGGEYWGVPNVPPCLSSMDHSDHTLETLSMGSLVLNLNKLAREIPSTPAAQLVF